VRGLVAFVDVENGRVYVELANGLFDLVPHELDYTVLPYRFVDENLLEAC